MRKLTANPIAKPSGFTLIELVIVIVIIGILAAVAIPNMLSAAEEARGAKIQATLGMLKGAWGSAYAIKKAGPTCAEVNAQAQIDPVCSITGSVIKCAGVTLKDGTSQAEFTCGANIATAPDITVTVGL